MHDSVNMWKNMFTALKHIQKKKIDGFLVTKVPFWWIFGDCDTWYEHPVKMVQ